MSQTIAESLIEEGFIKGQIIGYRNALQTLLTSRFGPLPESLLERIRAANLEQLTDAAHRQILEIKNLEELSL